MKYKINCLIPQEQLEQNYLVWCKILSQFEGKEFETMAKFIFAIDKFITDNLGDIGIDIDCVSATNFKGLHVTLKHSNNVNSNLSFLNYVSFNLFNQNKYKVEVKSESVYSELDESIYYRLCGYFKHNEYKDLESFIVDLEKVYKYIVLDSYVFTVSTIDNGFEISIVEKEDFVDDEQEKEKVFLSSVKYLLTHEKSN